MAKSVSRDLVLDIDFHRFCDSIISILDLNILFMRK